MTSPGETVPSVPPSNLANSPADLSVETGASQSADQISQTLAQTHTADECIGLAGLAGQTGDRDLKRRCCSQALALDRHCQAALLMLAAESMDDGDSCSTFALLEEAARAGLLPDNVGPLHRDLLAQMSSDPRLEDYFRAIGRRPADRPAKPLSIVLVTNLFPPQELGGYGRMMWEFAHGLIARGHRVRVLTSDVTEFGKNPTPDEVAMEGHIRRTLRMVGTWAGGRPAPLTDRAEIVRRMGDNAARFRAALAEVDADLVLAGNLDFLGISILQPALRANLPVLHALANASPGYAAAEQPRDAHYWVAPCSNWNGEVFAQAGFTPSRRETLYPGARVDRFFRLFLPDVRRLRICYASLVLPYKGADTLVDALGRLHQAGIDFTAEIAGDAPDATFLADLQDRVRRHGLEGKVRFPGFLDRRGLAGLFARNNVLVFPSRFQEPFGISQVEALAAGLVVVSSGTGGAREIIRAGVDGLLFNAGSDADLAEKLASLAREPQLMSRLQQAGQARACTFSVENAVRKIEALAGDLQATLANHGRVDFSPATGRC
jgi:glycosyltransferase involved in cell wall biosynthesis